MENKKQTKEAPKAPVMVKLKTKKNKKGESKERSFEISQANELLKLRKTQWELADKGFKWNGSEIAKA